MRFPKRIQVKLPIYIGLFFPTYMIAQTSGQNCPQYTQIPGDKGMANDANINITMMDSDAGTWNDNEGSNDQAAEDAIDGWTAMPGSNQDYNLSNVAGLPSEVSSYQEYVSTNGTAANPVIVVVQDSTANTMSLCGSVACTLPIVDSTGTAIGAVVTVSTDIVNGTPPPSYPSTLTETLSHEMGVHADMGWKDCTGDNCQNTDSGSGLYSAPGPTQCDTNQAKACGR